MADLKLPQHADPTSPNRIASAPYNFVPLPERVVPVEESFAELHQNRYYSEPTGDIPGRYTGHIECTLTTEAPLYVRCGLTLEQFAQSEREKTQDAEGLDYRTLAKNTPAFFYTQSPDFPVIPGSSLRGMLRALVEIVSYGKMEKVTDRKLFFRTVDDTAIGEAYRKRMMDRIRGGFIHLRGRGAILEECRVYTVEYDIIKAQTHGEFYIGRGPNAIPDWRSVQHRTVWVQTRDFSADDPTKFGIVQALSINEPKEGDWQLGVLVFSGPMQNKKHEFVFVKQPVPRSRSIEEDIVTRFHDDDQITRWQARAFPKNRPVQYARQRNGMLPIRQEEPIFFLVDDHDDDRVIFFGRAKMFRLPYIRSSREFVPLSLRSGDIDIAEAIFGNVPQYAQDSRSLIAGRVFVSSARCTKEDDEIWLMDTPSEIITPHILSGPKPTTFQHYLVQNELNGQPRAHNRKQLSHYDSSASQTTLRGHKLYWHRGRVARESIEDHAFLAQQNAISSRDTQHTQLSPVKSGVTFTFDIHFENLSRIELGALLWVLRLCDDNYTADKGGPYRFKLGMGKPLGMGSVKLTTTAIKHIEHQRRYAALFDDTGWITGEHDLSEADYNDCLHQFEQYVLKQSGERARGYDDLAGTLRMRCLLALLRWNAPAPEQIAYLGLDQFRYRPVLPTPLGVIGEKPPQPTQQPEQEANTSDKSDIVRIETRMRGVVVQVAMPGRPGQITGIDNRRYDYDIEDVIGVAPMSERPILFRPDKKKVKQGNAKKNINWAYDVEITMQ